MRLRQVFIRRFRGIKSCAWKPGSEICCLIGPGDATKTTILDAIEYALSPRWNTPFDDGDFYQSDTSKPILIRVTVTGMPDSLLAESRFGPWVRGWSVDDKLHDEPRQGDEPALTIELRVDDSHEPVWRVRTKRDPDGKRLRWQDGDALGCTRLGDFVDRHFTWSQGSALSRLTARSGELGKVLAGVAREARKQFDARGQGQLQSLEDAAKAAQRAAEEFGVAPRGTFAPKLDVAPRTLRAGAVSLHDDEVALSRSGLGTRRLVCVAMQSAGAADAGVTLIDEVEHALEPHRIRQMLDVIRTKTTVNQQVILTSHSSIVVEELGAAHLAVVESRRGVTTATNIPLGLQSVVRAGAECLLSRRVVVCEGATEIGFVRGLDKEWSRTGLSLGRSGVSLLDGGGTRKSLERAVAIAELGYAVAVLCDSDDVTVDVAELGQSGVDAFVWDGKVAIEQRICLDLPWDAVVTVVEAAEAQKGEQSVRGSIAARCAYSTQALEGAASIWKDTLDEVALRAGIGSAAHKSGWFKTVSLGEELGRIVAPRLAEITGTDLARKLTALKDWISE